MDSSEYQIIEKIATHCDHCNRNTLLPYEYERSCISCGFNLIKRKHELITKNEKKTLTFD